MDYIAAQDVLGVHERHFLRRFVDQYQGRSKTGESGVDGGPLTLWKSTDRISNGASSLALTVKRLAVDVREPRFVAPAQVRAQGNRNRV